MVRPRLARVPHAGRASAPIHLRLYGLPAGAPNIPAIVNVKVLTAIIHRHIVVAVAGQATEFGVLVKGVTTCGIGHQAEKVLIARVVNPGIRGFGIGNHILTSGGVRVTKRRWESSSLVLWS